MCLWPVSMATDGPSDAAQCRCGGGCSSRRVQRKGDRGGGREPLQTAVGCGGTWTLAGGGGGQRGQQMMKSGTLNEIKDGKPEWGSQSGGLEMLWYEVCP